MHCATRRHRDIARSSVISSKSLQDSQLGRGTEELVRPGRRIDEQTRLHRPVTRALRALPGLYSEESQTYLPAALKLRSVALLVFAASFALGCWARIEALHAGLWADDYAQYAMVKGAYPLPRAPWDLFSFLDGTQAEWQRAVDTGINTWWTHPQFRLRFLRPLPSLSVALDEALFGRAEVPRHLHSFLWFGLLLGTAALVFFSVLPPAAAAAATLFFALDESLTVPVLWLCNRNALMATSFALAALYFHVRWRAQPSRASRIASIAMFLLAVSCGEYALASFGYLLCFELVRPATNQERVRALAPVVLTTALFLALSAALGFGAAHSGLYTSPFGAPLDYANKLTTGVPALLGELTLGVSADFWHFGTPWPARVRASLQLDPQTWERLPSWHFWQVCLGLLGAGLALRLMFWLKRRLDPAHFRGLVWLTGGAVLGLLPVLGSFVSARLAMPSSFGFAALFGSVLVQGAREVSRGPQRSGKLSALLVGGFIAYVHGFHAWTESQRTTEIFSHMARSRTYWPLSINLDEHKSAQQTIVMIASPDVNDSAFWPLVRYAWGRPKMQAFRVLSGSPGSHDIERVDTHTLEVHIADGSWLPNTIVGSLTRDAAFRVGDSVSIAGMQVTVLALAEGQPVHMRYRFDLPLDDERLVFVHSTVQGLRRFGLPPIGRRERLPPPAMPDLSRISQVSPTAL